MQMAGEMPADIAFVVKQGKGTGKFFTVIDALKIGRVKFQITEYDTATNTSSGVGAAYMPVPQMRLIIAKIEAINAAIITGSMVDSKFSVHDQFGGGFGDDNGVESRVIRWSYDTDNGRFAALPYRVEITIGPGIRSGNGAVQPDPAQKAKSVSRFLRLSVDEAWTLVLTIKAYLDVNAALIIETKNEEQGAKRDKRIARKGGVAFRKDVQLPVAFKQYAAGTLVSSITDKNVLRELAAKPGMALVAIAAKQLLGE